MYNENDEIRKKQNQEQQHTIMTTNNAWYDVLPEIFKHLEIYELLRVTQVCTTWRYFAERLCVWKSVCLRQCRITDWKILADTLRRRRTRTLYLSDILVSDESDFWKTVVTALSQIISLVNLTLSCCPVTVVEEVIKNCPWLNGLIVFIPNCYLKKCNFLNLESIGNLNECQHLLLGVAPKDKELLWLELDLTPIQKLTQLIHLALVSIKNLENKNIDVIQTLTKLHTLTIIKSAGLPETFGTNVLQKLKNLTHLNLEYLTRYTRDLFEGISKLENLRRVILCGFNIRDYSYIKYIADCKNIKRLRITSLYSKAHYKTLNVKNLSAVLEDIKQISNILTQFTFSIPIPFLNEAKIYCDTNKQDKDALKTCLEVHKSKLEDVRRQELEKFLEEFPLPQFQEAIVTALPKSRIVIEMLPHCQALQLILRIIRDK